MKPRCPPSWSCFNLPSSKGWLESLDHHRPILIQTTTEVTIRLIRCAVSVLVTRGHGWSDWLSLHQKFPLWQSLLTLVCSSPPPRWEGPPSEALSVPWKETAHTAGAALTRSLCTVHEWYVHAPQISPSFEWTREALSCCGPTTTSFHTTQSPKQAEDRTLLREKWAWLKGTDKKQQGETQVWEACLFPRIQILNMQTGRKEGPVPGTTEHQSSTSTVLWTSYQDLGLVMSFFLTCKCI